MLLQDFLSPSQYIRDAQVREHSAERVEYAVRLPLHDGEEMLLPVDVKFPREDHEQHDRGIGGRRHRTRRAFPQSARSAHQGVRQGCRPQNT